MSQEKVDRYKEEKRNRKTIQAKKKRNALIAKLCGGAAVLCLSAWIGYSAVDAYKTSLRTGTITADTSALDTYVNSLSAEE